MSLHADFTRSLAAWGLLVMTAASAIAQPKIERRVPPQGLPLAPDQQQRIDERLARLKLGLRQVTGHRLLPDVEVLVKAVEYAVEHGEFYRPQDVEFAVEVLNRADRRLQDLVAGRSPWQMATGLVVRGYRSPIDDSAQPYGLQVPPDLELDKPVPLYVWLHGRGDKITDLHFIRRRLSRESAITPPGAIVLHPFGRQCIGFKSAGEIDVLDAIEHVATQYPIDLKRVALLGFSMGGAGAWHLGAHYADRWVALSPGAGFAETAEYNRLSPADYPAWYEQQLWGLYDVPPYVRNLFNLPVVAYSGEHDKQIQSVRVMEDAYRSEGRVLPHVIGPGVGHRLEPDALAEVMRFVEHAVRRERQPIPKTVSLQTRTLRYSRVHWVQALRLEQHWQEARIDAKIVADGKVQLTTSNVQSLSLSPWRRDPADWQVEIDGQPLQMPATNEETGSARFDKFAGTWRCVGPADEDRGLRKRPGLQGPIDDVFLEPFLVVTPSGTARHAGVQKWVEFELQHLRERWRALFRGELRTKADVDVSEQDLQQYHLILWGDPSSNALLRRVTRSTESKHSLPIDWSTDEIRIGGRRFSAERHVPVMIYPNPLQPDRYLVLNSGPTFREAHDRTNSLQNPKLPDWAVIDLSQPPSAERPGRIAAADFFDESWQVKE